MPESTSLASLLRNAGTSLRLEGTSDGGLTIEGVRDDSRRVRPGDLFVARTGSAHDGGRFIGEAIQHGAVAVVACEGVEVPNGPLVIRCKRPEEALGCLANAFQGNPADAMTLLGITGTNGKTTAATLIKQLLNVAGVKSGLMGTVEVDDGHEIRPTELTTPGAIELVENLARMRANGCRASVMEVSSHGLAQGRTCGLDFDVALFMNLSGDHLDFHGSMEEYAQAKAILFSGLKKGATALVNAHDPASKTMLADCVASTLGVRVGNAEARIDVEELITVTPKSVDAKGMELEIDSPWGHGACHLPLVGSHNAFNAGIALSAVCSQGISFQDAIDGLKQSTPPRGRLEPVHQPEDQLKVFVDYAHTDDAIANVLAALRGVVVDDQRLTVVFGAGGDRDRSKRPRMVQAACAGADLVMVTSDNPRTEDPEQIVREILDGVPAGARKHVQSEVDRAAAIARVIQEGRPGDIIVIAGKGHEDYQIIGTTKRHFDDVEVAREALLRRREAAPA